jgi:hypothetical protein
MSLLCTLQVLFETFFTKINVRQHTNKSTGLQVTFRLLQSRVKKNFAVCAKFLKLKPTHPSSTKFRENSFGGFGVFPC